jgi:hypothetical protein
VITLEAGIRLEVIGFANSSPNKHLTNLNEPKRQLGGNVGVVHDTLSFSGLFGTRMLAIREVIVRGN